MTKSVTEYFPTGTPLQWRPITPDDIGQWLELLKRMAEEDKPDWVEERADLEQILESSKTDPVQDTILGLDADGVPRAFGAIQKNHGSTLIHTMGGVDPAWRRRGIGTALYGWQVGRARRRLDEDGAAAGVLRTYAEERVPSQLALMEATGNTVVRYFTEMTRPLRTEIPTVEIPAGLRIATFSEELSEAVRLAHNEAFQDHWGSEPRDQESWRYTVTHPEFKPDWSLAVVDEETGEVAAYQLVSFDPGSKDILGYTEAYTDLLGVRRNWRGLRLAPALLVEAMRRFAADGIENAGLGVDTENPSGALGLYERLGYEPTHRVRVCELPI
ncbi:GNAT family N-acetyltransferase [Arthrobacter sp. CAN_C5]|uniref:GNAT family N-acetyltransferase n=1 Tax=Arthrobacter sp. CAN_C5 TaxID=2760706 RepID=UPI001FD89108|nr:GNAT family N-acetyltransferase [Arthrobacter sp. CAN_C5]MBP2217307.1 ribosomal protein S18 acetylase RimI-like enzyme [Arthrobacter sp. CAN_C5]